MKETGLAAKAKHLYERFLAPMVLGGEITPGPAIGARDALRLDGGLAAVDPNVRSQVDVTRVRLARRLVPIDTLDAPSADDWALAAALHDLVHALHPDLEGILRQGAPGKLVDQVDAVLKRVSASPTLADEVARYTYFGRLFEIARTDTHVSWWSGSRLFIGTGPSPRLLAWPQLRRVRTQEESHALTELPTFTRGLAAGRFWNALDRFLAKAPLTDLATCARPTPAFAWNGANLGLFARPHTRTVALRALALQPSRWVDATLARATRIHVKNEAWENLAHIADVLAERALVMATSDAPNEPLGPEPDVTLETDAAYARAFGALVALGKVPGLAMSGDGARTVAAKLLPIAQSATGRELAGLVERIRVPI